MALAQSKNATGARGASVIDRLPAPIPGMILAAFVLTAVLLTAHREVLSGELIDTDSYMHLVRLRAVIADGAWHDGFFARDNAPFGMALHWTKAYDLIYLALAAPIAALVGWHTALAWAAPAIGPLAIFALILAAVWAVAPICDAAERRLVGIVLALAPMLLLYGAIGDTDHHAMVVGAWLLFMGFALRVALGGGLRQGVWAGLAAAFALWLSVECVLGVALGIALMGVAWVREGEGLRRVSLGFAGTFGLAMVLVLAFDAPYGGWLEAEPDRLSILYIAFALLLALLWGALALAPQLAGAWQARLVVAVAGAVLSAICLAVLFPAVFAPEQAVFGAALGVASWNEVDEMVPAFRRLNIGIIITGGPAIGLAVAMARAWWERRTPAGPAWAAFALMLALLTALGLRHLRFLIYPEVMAALPIAVLLNQMGPFIDRMAPASLRLFGQTLAGVAVLAGPMLLGGAVAAATGDTPPERLGCGVRTVAPVLNDPRFMGSTNLVIMSHPNEAPDLLYWTEHRVVAGPYHTNVEGLRDLLDFFTSRDDSKALAIAALRGIGFVMFCTGDLPITDPAGGGRQDLYMRLLHGEVPRWLAAQPWPAGITSELHLFRVVSPPRGMGR